MPAVNGSPDPAAVASTVEYAKHTQLLGAILGALRTEVPMIGVSDAAGREMVLEHWPTAGMKRVLVERTGNGTDGTSIPTTGQLLVPANEGRLGSTWINTGANAVIIYLAAYAKKGAAAVWLASNGGSWDGRFGGLVWQGNLFAVAQTAATTIVGGEI